MTLDRNWDQDPTLEIMWIRLLGMKIINSLFLLTIYIHMKFKITKPLYSLPALRLQGHTVSGIEYIHITIHGSVGYPHHRELREVLRSALPTA